MLEDLKDLEENEITRQSRHQRHKEMTDSERTVLRTAITEVLPDLSEVTKDILEETLQSIGVETYDDFQFTEEADLLSVLAAWKLRCQTPETSSFSVSASPGPPAFLLSISPRSSSSASSSSCQSPEIDWVDSFMIPWDKFPEELIQLNGEMKKDIIEGEVVGPGYHSLDKQLKYRVENVKRSSTPKIRKRKHRTDESDTDKVPPEKRAAIQDTYGCINWDLKFLPLGETPESQQEKKEKLKMMSQQTNANSQEVRLLMRATFYTQRKQVNQGKNIKYLLEERPFWFDKLGMAVHFKELTGIGLKETFTRNVDLKGKQLLNYMNTVCVNRNRKFPQAVTKCKVMKGEPSGCSEDVKEMVLLQLSYFNEKEDVMFSYVEDTCLAGEIQMDQVQLTPTIVVCGRSCYSAGRFMLSVDRSIVQDSIPSFISALCMMIGNYYCFNIHYPSELTSTLMFLQRCFFSINPEKGTKVEKTTTSRLPVNPRVLTLIQELSAHEWCDV
ncbi:hypothetical protein AOLI_G00059050 [Acnodon oligacanthus]